MSQFVKSRVALSLLFMICLVGSAYAERTFKDILVQAPSLNAPSRGSISGSLSQLAFGPTDVLRGAYALPLPMTAPNERGPLLAEVFASYHSDSGLSEWGMGFSVDLSIERFRLTGDIDYQSDEFKSPWGRLKKGDDGYWYALGLAGRVRLTFTDGKWTAIAPDGTRYLFHELLQTSLGTYAWYLNEVISVRGDRTTIAYQKNDSGRLFVKEVSYGSKSAPDAYRIQFVYEQLTAPFTHYRARQALVLDRRIKQVLMSVKNGSGSYEQRWSYSLAYSPSPLGPAFYLSSVTRHFPSGNAEPSVVYSYDFGDKHLAQTQFKHLAQLDTYIGLAGGFGIDPEYSSVTDVDNDGRPDIEHNYSHTLVHQTDSGWDFEELPQPANVNQNCRPAPYKNNPSRYLARMTADANEPHVVATFEKAGHQTQLLICDRQGVALHQSMLEGNWELGQNVRLVDLNRDFRPEIIWVFNGHYQVMENLSQGSTFTFKKHPMQELSPSFTPNGVWYSDMNGDGIADLVARNSTALVIWYGTGGMQFVKQGVEHKLFNQTGDQLANVEDYDLFYTDINRDGLADILAYQTSFARLYINHGDKFILTQINALEYIGINFGVPLVADLAGQGETELVLVHDGQAFALDLSTPSTGLLTRVDDGKGTIAEFGYSRSPAVAGVMHRISQLTSMTLKSSGTDPLVSSYTYSQPVMHSLGKFLVGYTHVNQFSPFSTKNLTFYNDDELAGVVLEAVEKDQRTPDIYSFERHVYDEQKLFGVRFKQPKSTQTGWGDKKSSVEYALSSEVLSYENGLCPLQTKSTLPQGTLIQTLKRAAVADLKDALHCLHESETLQGQHSDASLDFKLTQRLERNSKGQITKVIQDGAQGPLVQQEILYDADFRVDSLIQPGRGTTGVGYDGATGLLQQVVTPDGVVMKVVQRDAATDAILELETDRGAGGIFRQSFRYDGMERLQKSWGDFSGASEAKPEAILSYHFATQGTAGAILAQTLLDTKSGTYKQGGELFTGNGGPLATLSRIPEGWAISQLVSQSHSKLESRRYIRTPLEASANLAALPFSSLLDGKAVELGVSQKAAFGYNLFSQNVVQNGVDQTLSAEFHLQAGAQGAGELVISAVENGAYKTRTAKDLAGNVRWIEDQKGLVTRFAYDALGRLRTASLPDNTWQSRWFDSYGRVAGTSRKGLGSIAYQYDSVSGLLTQKTFKDGQGKVERSSAFEYDGIGRPSRSVHTLAASGEQQIYTFEHDGGASNPIPGQLGRLTNVDGDGYGKTQIFNPDGTLKKLTIWLAGWMEVTWDYTYYADGTARTSTRTVRDLKSDSVKEKVSIENLYDGYGRLNQLMVDGKALLSVAYDSEGKPKLASFAGGATLTLSYDPKTKNLSGYDAKTANWTQGMAWDFDARGHISQERFALDQKQLTRDYQYDARGFLVKALDADGVSQYAYDYVGLPTSSEDLQGLRNLTRTSQSNGGFSMQVGGTAYSFDALGRLIHKGDLDLSYGADGHLIVAQRQNQRWQFVYDEEGNRILKLKDGLPVAGYISGGYLTEKGFVDPVKVLGRLVGVLEHGQFQHLATDPRGTLLADKTGAERMPTPYGVRATRPDLSSALDYVEKGYDADLGSVRMGVRDYDPLTGQFWSPDPLILEGLDGIAQSPLDGNLYSYAGNNPLLFNDPNGQLPEAIETYMEGNFAHVASNNLPTVNSALLPSHARPYPVNIPGGQPWPYYLGNEAHKKIFERVKELNLNLNAKWYGNNYAIQDILKATKKGWALDFGQGGKPDITFIRHGVAHVYEIKPFTMASDAYVKVDYYVNRWNAGGLPAVKGASSLIGCEMTKGPGGIFAFWSPDPGVILYAYFKANKNGELFPAKGTQKTMQWQRFLDALPDSQTLQNAKLKSQIEGLLKTTIEGTAAIRMGSWLLRGSPTSTPTPVPMPR